MQPLNRSPVKTAFGVLLLLASAMIFAGGRSFADEFKHGDISVIQPWSRATPGGAQVAAGYVVIRNVGAKPDRLLSARVEIAGAATIHQMAMADGVMTMRELKEGIVIPAKGEIALKPGSYHLMLTDLKHPLKAGESFKGSFTFEKAGTIEATFAVEPIGAPAPASGSQMHDGM